MDLVLLMEGLELIIDRFKDFCREMIGRNVVDLNKEDFYFLGIR